MTNPTAAQSRPSAQDKKSLDAKPNQERKVMRASYSATKNQQPKVVHPKDIGFIAPESAQED